MPYKESWIERAKNPRHFSGAPGSAGRYTGKGYNPTCGDEIYLCLEPQNGRIHRATFGGVCCAVCMASADALCDEIEHLPVREAKALVGAFRGVLRGTGGTEEKLRTDLAYDLVFIAETLPSRVRCADLAWRVAEEVMDRMEG